MENSLAMFLIKFVLLSMRLDQSNFATRVMPKLDIENDHVNWNFLLLILAKMNFNWKWLG